MAFFSFLYLKYTNKFNNTNPIKLITILLTNKRLYSESAPPAENEGLDHQINSLNPDIMNAKPVHSICCLNKIAPTMTNIIPAIENIQISEIVNIMMTEFAFQNGEKNSVNLDLKQNFIFKGDKNLAVFVLFNLLKNALYHQGKINIHLERKEDYNLLHFKDTGAGIPADKLPAIFESFITSDKKEGTGLGLPFCKRVMKGFDGDITCNSKKGEYTEFILHFPRVSYN